MEKQNNHKCNMERKSIRNAVFFSSLLIVALCLGLNLGPANITVDSDHSEASNNTAQCETQNHGGNGDGNICDEEDGEKLRVKN